MDAAMPVQTSLLLLIAGCIAAFAVADTGIGIHPDAQERIFREFEQVDSSCGRMQQGTGLGLALTRRLVELHQGRIRVESAGVERRGSVFTVELRVDSRGRAGRGAARRGRLPAPPSLTGTLDTHSPYSIGMLVNIPRVSMKAYACDG